MCGVGKGVGLVVTIVKYFIFSGCDINYEGIKLDVEIFLIDV